MFKDTKYSLSKQQNKGISVCRGIYKRVFMNYILVWLRIWFGSVQFSVWLSYKIKTTIKNSAKNCTNRFGMVRLTNGTDKIAIARNIYYELKI